MGDFNSTTTHTAKKPHWCECCRGQIQIGESYVRNTGSFDGDFSSVAVCLGCESLMQTLFQNDETGWFHDNGIEYGRAWEYACELDLVCLVKHRQAIAA